MTLAMHQPPPLSEYPNYRAKQCSIITSAPETIRTSDTFFRREVLYPLSYGGVWAT